MFVGVVGVVQEVIVVLRVWLLTSAVLLVPNVAGWSCWVKLLGPVVPFGVFFFLRGQIHQQCVLGCCVG